MLHVFVLQVLCNLIDVHGNGVLRVSPGGAEINSTLPAALTTLTNLTTLMSWISLKNSMILKIFTLLKILVNLTFVIAHVVAIGFCAI